MSDQTSGITDKAAVNAHDFLESTEAKEHQAHPDAQLNRGEATVDPDKGLANPDKSIGQGEQKGQSTMDSIKEALHLKK